MKKFLGCLLLMVFLSLGTAVYSITVGIEPPSQYMYNLKSCTPNVTSRIKYGMVGKYEIKGKLPDGRCQVIITMYQNFTQESYEIHKSMYKSMAKSMLGKEVDDYQTREQLIRDAKKNKEIMVCKFSAEQRAALYNAYLKHDGKNSINFAYDNLMLNYSSGTCSQE